MSRGRGAAVAAIAAFLLIGPSPAEAIQGYRAECNTAFCGGLSEDGTRAVFPFREVLAEGAELGQIYERFGGITRALIPYPQQVPERTYTNLVGLSADARHVFVSTTLPLAAEDRDGGGTDVYDVFAGDAKLLSTGPLDTQADPGFGPMSAPMFFQGASADGERVFLDSLFEPLVPEDTDRCPDAYERFEGQTKLISTGPNATASYPAPLCDIATFNGLSSDGSHVFFRTGDHLVAEDEGGDDLYQRVGEQLTVLTTYDERAERNCVDLPEFGDASADGGTVLFSTNMPIAAEDTDSTYDVYKRRPDGSYVLVSRGTEGGIGPCGFGGDKPVALSADGGTAIFETVARLSPEDGDSSLDLYSADASGAMSLVTTGPTDASLDEHFFVSPAWPADVSSDARYVAFESRQALVEADADGSVDVYLRGPAGTELVSTGPLGGNASANAELLSISGDGGIVAFATKERLTDLDTDAKMDFYLRRLGQLARPGSATASKRARRTVLISAESIAPRMRVGRRGRILGPRRAAVRLACPKQEKSGPCHGALRLVSATGGRGIGRAGFQVAAGREKWVAVPVRGSLRPSGGMAPIVRVRGVDRLGNARRVARRVSFPSR